MVKMRRLLVVAALMVPLLGTGCAPHREVYAWTPGEETYYVQWEHETHREHVDWGRRNDDEHRQYWEWRHHHHHD